MGNTIDTIKAISIAFGAIIGSMWSIIGGVGQVLIFMMVADYITGLLAGAYAKELNSKRGFMGIAKKIVIIIYVGVAWGVDTYILGGSGVISTAVMFFYISNEGLSILENGGKLGVVTSPKLVELLEQLKENKSAK